MDLETYFTEKMITKDKFRRKLGFRHSTFFKMLNTGNMSFDWAEKIINETNGKVKLKDLFNTYLEKTHNTKKSSQKTKRKKSDKVE